MELSSLTEEKWVFIDWQYMEPGYGVAWDGGISDGYCMPEGIRLRVHHPRIDPEPVLFPDRPWESLGLGWATFLQDGGRFRCWYDAHIPYDHPRWKVAVRLAYAESDDGVTWRKPELGYCEFNGSMANNLLTVDGPWPNLSGHVFVDPSAPPDSRYKLVGPGGRHGVLGAVSQDGYSWKGLTQPVLPKNNSDTDNCCEYLPEIGRYVLFTRQHDGRSQRRGVFRSESADFSGFPTSVPVIDVNPLDPPDWDYYSNAFCRWPGTSDAFLMCIGVFRRTLDTVEGHLAISRDTVRWHRPLGLDTWLQLDRELEAAYPQVYLCHGILPTSPGEWSIYFDACRTGHNEAAKDPAAQFPCILRGTLREDGFMSLTADGHGQFWSIPFVMQANQVRVNLKTRYGGYLKCEIIETAVAGSTGASVSRGEAVTGFTLADCDPISGDHCDKMITWKGSADLSRFAGKEIRLHFSLCKADLYAVKF